MTTESTLSTQADEDTELREMDEEVERDEDDQDAAPEPVFGSVVEFVEERFIPVFCRPEGGQFRWCAEWWRHPEAVSRFQALWHSWEVMRLEPGTGMAIWYRDYLDTQLPVLLGDTGPFRECTSRRHQEPRPLPSTPPPAHWFD